jgi:hypothetical protein
MLTEELAHVISTAHSMTDVARIVAKTDRAFAVKLVEKARDQLHLRLKALAVASSIPSGDMLMVAASAAVDQVLDAALATVSALQRGTKGQPPAA